LQERGFSMTHFLLPLADVGSAFNGISGMLVSYLGAVLAFILIVAGYTYMFALDDHNKAAQAKRAIGVAIVGAILIALAMGLGPKIVTTIGH
jgi:Type IV secretion system pilin